MGMLVTGNRNAQRQAHEPVEGLPVYNENIRSPVDAAVPITGGNLALHPIGPEVTYAFVELPGGPASSTVLIVGDTITVQMTYDPAVTTDIVMGAAVAADPASALLLTILNPTGLVMPAGLGGTGGNLWSDLIAVPGATFVRSPTTGRWISWDGGIAGGAAMVAALLAIQANTSPDNRMDSQTIDLTGARVDVALGLAGRHLNVLNLTGTASIRLVNGGVPYPTLPDPACDIFPIDEFGFDFTDVLLTNGAQPGMWLTLAAMWRV